MTKPTPDDIRCAVDWALTHDLAALLAYRQIAHLDKSARWKADATLVARWQRATSEGSHRCGPRPLTADPRAHC